MLPRRINETMHGKRAITAETVLRLSYFFATEPQLRMNLAARYTPEVAKDALAGRLERSIGVPDHAAGNRPFDPCADA